jgi:hypothetical protein
VRRREGREGEGGGERGVDEFDESDSWGVGFGGTQSSAEEDTQRERERERCICANLCFGECFVSGFTNIFDFPFSTIAFAKRVICILMK